MVFQTPVLLPWRTVLNNVLLPLQVEGRSNREFRIHAGRLLNMVGLGDFADRYPSELSGGMQQRASIVRALVRDPPVLLMDEPFGALDALTREELNLQLQDIWLETSKTVIFVTHSIAEAVFLADRVIVLSDRPGTIRETIDIGLPRPRVLDVMTSEEFGSHVRHIRSLLGGGSIDSEEPLDIETHGDEAHNATEYRK